MILSVLLRSEQQQQSKPDQNRLSRVNLKLQRNGLMNLETKDIFNLSRIYKCKRVLPTSLMTRSNIRWFIYHAVKRLFDLFCHFLIGGSGTSLRLGGDDASCHVLWAGLHLSWAVWILAEVRRPLRAAVNIWVIIHISRSAAPASEGPLFCTLCMQR